MYSMCEVQHHYETLANTPNPYIVADHTHRCRDATPNHT